MKELGDLEDRLKKVEDKEGISNKTDAALQQKKKEVEAEFE
jgi:hypothetical protein